MKIKIEIHESKTGETSFHYCRNGEASMSKAAKLQSEGKSIDELSVQEKAFLSCVHNLYAQGFICTSEKE